MRCSVSEVDVSRTASRKSSSEKLPALCRSTLAPLQRARHAACNNQHCCSAPVFLAPKGKDQCADLRSKMHRECERPAP